MGKFLAIYNGAADASKKGQLTEAERLEFLGAWAQWAQASQQALVDPGAPLYKEEACDPWWRHGLDGLQNGVFHRRGR